MAVQFESLVVASLKLLLAAGACFLIYALASFLYVTGCPITKPSAAVLYSVFLSLLALFVYTKFDCLSVGIFRLGVSRVRLWLGCSLLFELVGMAIFIWRTGCERPIGELAIPFALIVFYTVTIFAVLFGDGFLGVMRKVIRLGVPPH